VKISQPKGGLAEPMAACNTSNIPIKTGSIPALIMYGLNMGDKCI